MNLIDKLLNAYGEDTELRKDEWSLNKIFIADNRKWIANIVPADLLKRTLKEAIESLTTLSQDNIAYNKFPDNIITPNYGDNWGVKANYI